MMPTRRQIILASGWLPALWQWSWSLAAIGWTASKASPSAGALTDPEFVLLFCAAIVLAFAAGWAASIIPMWLVFGPLLYDQGLKNGGPFAPGDRVQVLAGRHRGRIAYVYATSQHDAVRVDLGEQAKQRYQDIYAPH